MNDDQIHRIFRQKQRWHHELRRELDWIGVQRICKREELRLVVRPHPETAQLVGVGGVWMIIIDSGSPIRRHTYYAAHELAHFWLHVEAAGERYETVFRFDGCVHDEQEGEAEYLATLMLGGPRFHRHF